VGSDARASPGGVTIVVAPAVEGDLPEVSAMERACYSDPWAPSAFVGLHDNPAVHFAVARTEARGAVAGYVVAWFVADEGELANLAVTPGARRRGIGRALLDSVLADATTRGVRSLYLEVRESNAAARKLYASRDFVEIGRRKGYYRSPQEDALILRCTLKR
jgi:[ribosomal protein S18]-alanine N-acetyltransferase